MSAFKNDWRYDYEWMIFRSTGASRFFWREQTVENRRLFIIMKKQTFPILMILLVSVVLLLSACASRSTPSPDDPVSSNDPTPSAPDPNSLLPQPNDDQLERGTVEITATEIFTLESFPPQFMVNIEGSKATPCHQLRAVIGEPGDSKEIRIEVYTVFSPDAVCVQMIENFNVNLPLGSYASGTYTVYVNDVEIGQIMAP